MASHNKRIQAFRLTADLTGVDTKGRITVFTVPKGVTVKLAGAVQRSGLVNVEFQDRTAEVFLDDLLKCSEKVASVEG